MTKLKTSAGESGNNFSKAERVWRLIYKRMVSVDRDLNTVTVCCRIQYLICSFLVHHQASAALLVVDRIGVVENDVVGPSRRCVSADEKFQAFTLSNSLNNVHAIDHYLGTSPWFRSDPTLTESGEQTQGPSLYARHVDLHNSSGPC